MPNRIFVNVSGPEHSGKGNLIASIAHHLQSLGCNVVVQCAETHNAKKLNKSDEEIAQRLQATEIIITELQT